MTPRGRASERQSPHTNTNSTNSIEQMVMNKTQSTSTNIRQSACAERITCANEGSKIIRSFNNVMREVESEIQPLHGHFYKGKPDSLFYRKKRNLSWPSLKVRTNQEKVRFNKDRLDMCDIEESDSDAAQSDASSDSGCKLLNI